jgi:hypothetical protein
MKVFIFFPKHFWALWKEPDTPKKLGQFGNFIVPNKFGQIIKNEFFWGYCPHFWVLTDMRERERESMLVNKIRSPCERALQ